MFFNLPSDRLDKLFQMSSGIPVLIKKIVLKQTQAFRNTFTTLILSNGCHSTKFTVKKPSKMFMMSNISPSLATLYLMSTVRVFRSIPYPWASQYEYRSRPPWTCGDLKHVIYIKNWHVLRKWKIVKITKIYVKSVIGKTHVKCNLKIFRCSVFKCKPS